MKLKFIMAAWLLGASLGAVSSVTGVCVDGKITMNSSAARKKLRQLGWSKNDIKIFVEAGKGDNFNSPAARDLRVALLMSPQAQDLPGNITFSQFETLTEEQAVRKKEMYDLAASKYVERMEAAARSGEISAVSSRRNSAAADGLEA